MPLHQHHWSMRMILCNWKSRGVEKPRANLPVEFTSSTLRYIRQMACRESGISNCEVWTDGERYVAFDDTPCKRCKHPGISNFKFSATLFGQKEHDTKAVLNKLDKDLLLTNTQREIRRFINSGAPMQADKFKRAVANACMHKWLTFSQAYSILQNILALESTSSWTRKFLKRLRDRASFKKARVITDDPAKITGELDAELRATQEAFLADGRQKIARSQHINAEDKQWLLRQNCVTEGANTY